MLKRGILIVFSGPSGVGKDTILATFMQTRSDCALSVSATTRSPRPGEVDGVHYHFVSKDEFRRMAEQGKMLEYAEYSGNCYGTPKEPAEALLAAGKNVILEIEPVGAMIVREKCPGAVFVFLMPPSVQMLRNRLAGRGTEDEAAIQKRLDIAKTEMKAAGRYDYIIINNTVRESCEKLSAIITAAGCAVDNMADFIKEVLKDA